MQTYLVEGYHITVTRTEETESPFATGIPYSYRITIAHETNKRIKVNVPYYSGRPVDALPEAARAFANLCNTALIGALAPMDFCRVMNIDPQDSTAEDKFVACREVTEKIFSILSAQGDKPAAMMYRIRSSGGKFYEM